MDTLRLLACLLFVPLLVVASTPGQSEAQVLQLPTIRGFSVNGAISVPDGGTVQLGGVNSSSEQANSAGVPMLGNIPGVGRGFKNRGIGREQQASGLNVKADLIIMEEIEADHLAKAGYGPGGIKSIDAQNADIQRKAAFLSKHVGRNGSSSKNDR